MLFSLMQCIKKKKKNLGQEITETYLPMQARECKKKGERGWSESDSL